MAVKDLPNPGELYTKAAPDWLRNPATVAMPKGVEEFIKKSNTYFEECLDRDERPTITGYALAVGLPGPTSLIRLGQRIPELRYPISRCMTAISYRYEDMIGSANAAGPMFMLKNIPDFDPDEPSGAPPIQFFNERKEVLLTMDVAGVASEGADADADPVEVYVEYLQRKGHLRPRQVESDSHTFYRAPATAHRPALEILSNG